MLATGLTIRMWSVSLTNSIAEALGQSVRTGRIVLHFVPVPMDSGRPQHALCRIWAENLGKLPSDYISSWRRVAYHRHSGHNLSKSSIA